MLLLSLPVPVFHPGKVATLYEYSSYSSFCMFCEEIKYYIHACFS